MNYKEWDMETLNDGDGGTIIISGDTGLYATTSPVNVVDGDIERIINDLVPDLVSITPPEARILINVGMVDSAWLEQCMNDIKKKAKYLSDKYMKHLEKVFCKEMYRQHCKI